MSQEYSNIINEKINTLMLDEELDNSEIDDSETDNSRLTQNIEVTSNNNIKNKSLSNNDTEDIGGMHRLQRCHFFLLYVSMYTYMYLCMYVCAYTYMYDVSMYIYRINFLLWLILTTYFYYIEVIDRETFVSSSSNLPPNDGSTAIKRKHMNLDQGKSFKKSKIRRK